MGKEGLHFIRDSGANVLYYSMLKLPTNRLTSGEARNCLVGREVKKEELLSQAIAFSEDNEEENDEEELLSQAIALSLEDWK